MAESVTYTCDVCGVQKKDANHWYKASGAPGKLFMVVHWDLGFTGILDPNLKQRELHLCGLSCAGKAMQRAMEAAPSEIGSAAIDRRTAWGRDGRIVESEARAQREPLNYDPAESIARVSAQLRREKGEETS